MLTFKNEAKKKKKEMFMPIINQNDPKQRARYESFVKNSPYGRPTQSLAWAQVKNNWTCDEVTLEVQGEIQASLSLIGISNDQVHSFLYAPRGPVCDPKDPALVRALLQEARPVIEKRKAFLVRMDPEVPYEPALVQAYQKEGFFVRTRGIDEHAFSNPRQNMILSLPGKNLEEIIGQMPARQRTKVRKTYRDGLQTAYVRTNAPNYEDLLDRFYALTEIMATRQKIGHRPRAYFDRVLKSFDDARLYYTWDGEGEILSMCLVIFYNRKAFYLYAASSNEKRSLNPSLQMNVEVIRDALEAGMEEYDMGGIFVKDMKSGLYHFKRELIGEESYREFLGEIDFVLDQDLYEDFLRR